MALNASGEEFEGFQVCVHVYVLASMEVLTTWMYAGKRYSCSGSALNGLGHLFVRHSGRVWSLPGWARARRGGGRFWRRSLHQTTVPERFEHGFGLSLPFVALCLQPGAHTVQPSLYLPRTSAFSKTATASFAAVFQTFYLIDFAVRVRLVSCATVVLIPSNSGSGG